MPIAIPNQQSTQKKKKIEDFFVKDKLPFQSSSTGRPSDQASRLRHLIDDIFEQRKLGHLESTAYRPRVTSTDSYSIRIDESILHIRRLMFDFVRQADRLSRQAVEAEASMQAVQSLSIDSMIKVLEMKAADLQADNRLALQRLATTANRHCNESIGCRRLNSSDVDRDLAESSQLEDDFMEYVEYRQKGANRRLICSVNGGSRNIEDQPCQACGDEDYSDDNLIVYCARCNVCVHRRCYGLKDVPDGNWVCELCLQFGPAGRFMRCAFCQRVGGCMLPTNLDSTDCRLEAVNSDYFRFMLDRKSEQTMPGSLYRNGDARIADQVVINS